GQRLGLFIVNALQQVFETTQIEVSLTQRLRIAVGQQMQRFNGLQRRQQRARLERRLAPAADQLKHLHDKFDFADPARAQLDVVGQAAAPYFPGDHALHVAQRLNDAEIDVAAE